ncbi:hypothetical protein E2C01_099394 [Portunus trituberculatus]|uniref:Uncharacterized protein n=1 Tax=Portunus trituberculatus TaxID=210409 RepID=A0A5B7KAP1_PORTR|nr:hypothetical protein [Portunus trituberculatus]
MGTPTLSLHTPPNPSTILYHLQHLPSAAHLHLSRPNPPYTPSSSLQALKCSRPCPAISCKCY